MQFTTLNKISTDSSAPLSYVSHRRWFGFALGTAMALVYALISQFINRVALPGIPLYQPPFGPIGNLGLELFLGMLIGAMCVWAEVSVWGVVLSSLLCSLVVMVASFFSGNTANGMAATKITALVIVYVPFAAMFAPALMIFRWIVNREENAYRNQQIGMPDNPLLRVALPLALVVLAFVGGALTLYNSTARTVIPRTQAMIQSAQQVQDVTALPRALQPPDVNLFLEKGQGNYTLQWDRDPNNHFAIPRPASAQGEQSIVIARFPNNYLLVCLYPEPNSDPICRDFDQPPFQSP